MRVSVVKPLTIPLPGDGQIANISNFDVSDEFLSTMPLPGDKQIASMSRAVARALIGGGGGGGCLFIYSCYAQRISFEISCF